MKTILAFLLLAGASAQAHTVGSGGDALRDLFNQARSAAAYNVNHLQWCSFADSTKSDTKDWILANAGAFAKDLEVSDHRWVVDAQPTCGFTDHNSRSPIYLSYPTCSSTVGTTLSSAVFTLMHETVHHFGIADEKQADEIARAIMDADLSRQCPPQVADVFDQKICQGPAFSTEDAKKYLPPAKTSAYIGDYKVYGKYRNCTKLSGCEDWKIQPVTTSLGTPTGFTVSLNSDPNSPGGFYGLASQIVRVGGYTYNVVGGRIGGGANSITFGSAPYTFAGVETINWAGSKMDGNFRKTCLWYYASGSTNVDASGFYRDAMVVVYGTH